jgi:hypothetical protein
VYPGWELQKNKDNDALDRSDPLFLLIVLAAWMAVAPINPEPHLVEKVRMLSQGVLNRPVDIIDLVYHLASMAAHFYRSVSFPYKGSWL